MPRLYRGSTPARTDWGRKEREGGNRGARKKKQWRREWKGFLNFKAYRGNIGNPIHSEELLSSRRCLWGCRRCIKCHPPVVKRLKSGREKKGMGGLEGLFIKKRIIYALPRKLMQNLTSRTKLKDLKYIYCFSTHFTYKLWHVAPLYNENFSVAIK